jgi:outer membrane protein assembly factor BamB
VQDFNALTGENVWTAPVGNANYPSLGPSASDKYVAIINGSTLYVLRRQDGKPVLDRRVTSGPGAGPAVAAEYVFVPLINGRMEGYPLNQGDDKSHTPWYYQSYGRAMVAPLATPDCVVWSTDQGNLYVASSLSPAVRFRLESDSDIIAPAAYHAPLIYAATVGGNVFAVDEGTGDRKWKYSTGFPIERAPAAVGDRVYVTTEEPVMHCIDAKTGSTLWVAPKVTQFAAASAQRVYGIDDLRALVVLDAKTGTLIARMPTDGTANALVNDQTDRLYLVSDGGLIQCLHEIGAKKPLYHNPAPAAQPKPEAKNKATTAGEAKPAEQQPQPAEGKQAAPPADAGDPFSGLNEAPAEGGEKAEKPPIQDGNFGVENGNPFETGK